MIVSTGTLPDVERFEVFSEFAKRRAMGEPLIPLTALPDHDRRLHIRQTLREDHCFRIQNRPEGAKAKFDKIAKSPLKFFRGAALLYYRDHCGVDARMPPVFTIGDVHPENFGVMPNRDGAPFFGANDFDEAFVAPCTWDVRRGAVGFELAGEEAGLSPKHRKKAVTAFVEGYLDGLERFAKDDQEKHFQYRLDNSPGIIRELLEDAITDRKEFLEDLIDLKKQEFRPSKKIVPKTRLVDEMQAVVNEYRKSLTADRGDEYFKVLDVAAKKGSGTASLGLDRYFILVNGRGDALDESVVLEMKQARRSALSGLAWTVEGSQIKDQVDREAGDEAERVTLAHRIHLVGGDPLYGVASYQDRSYLVRERSPFKDDIDMDDLSKKEAYKYASVCGATLAQTHARSDEDSEILDGDAEKKILESLDRKLFVADVLEFASSASDRIRRDLEIFREDHERGAFEFARRS